MTDNTSSTPFVEGRAEQRLNGAIARFNRWPAALRTVLVFASCVLGALLFFGVISAPLDLYSQCLFAAVCFMAVLVLRRIPGRLAILALVVLSLVFLSVSLPCMTLWALLGVGSARFFGSPQALKRVNYALAFLLLVSAWLTVLV